MAEDLPKPEDAQRELSLKPAETGTSSEQPGKDDALDRAATVARMTNLVRSQSNAAKSIIRMANLVHGQSDEARVAVRMANLVYNQSTGDLARIAEQIQRRHLETTRPLMASFSAARFAGVLGSSQHLHKMLTQTTTPLVGWGKVHDSWLEQARIVADSTRLAQIAKLSLYDVSHQMIFANRTLGRIDFDALRRQFNLQNSIAAGLERSVLDVTASYRYLTESFQSILEVVERPAFVLPGATRELRTTGYALEVLNPLEERLETDDVELESQFVTEDGFDGSGLIALLERADPELVPMYEGARDALNGDNPDRARHILTSLRELWNHLLRKLAPVEEAREWICRHGDQNDLDNRENPTRSGKIRYISRNINNDPLTKFLDADTKVFVKLYKMYNLLHSRIIELKDIQLHAIFYRTESWLHYILRIWALSEPSSQGSVLRT